MIKKLRTSWERFTVSLKLSVKANRNLLIAVVVMALLGFIFAVSSCVGEENTGTTVNIFIQIQSDSFSFFGFLLKILIYYAFFALLLFLSACHFYFLCASFAEIAIISFFYSKGMIFTIMFDGFTGFAIVVFYMIPIALVYLFTYFLALKDVYGIVGYDCNRKRFSHINFYKRQVFKCILKMLAWNFVIDIILTILIAIIAAVF